MNPYIWKLAERNAESEKFLNENTDLPTAVKNLLAARGAGPRELEEYTSDSAVFADPFDIKDMDKAVERVTQAIENGERIVVYGDYDCDGITSTALLYSYLESVGADVIYYIPDRMIEGYGLNNQAIKFLKDVRKIDLIITVDNGISAHEEVLYAKTLGVDVVITDHHTPRASLPDAAAVINPHRADDMSEFKNLAGVGVAFKLAAALEGEDGEELFEHFGDILALGTIADVVELRGENRLIVKKGLELLASGTRPGIRELLALSGVTDSGMSARTAAFILAPRINAAGRVGDVYRALELLLCEDDDTAAELASELCEYNDIRKQTETEILDQITHTLSQNPKILCERVCCVVGENWHSGVVGIIASKLVERFGKPFFILSFDKDGVGRASGRSVDGVNLAAVLSECSQHLERYGGHSAAAGFTLLRENFDAFSAALSAAGEKLCDGMPRGSLTADAVISPQDLSVETAVALEKLEPFGAGNEPPLFAFLGAEITDISPMSAGKHLRLTVKKKGKTFQIPFFGVSPEAFAYRSGDKIDLMIRISREEYRGVERLSIRAADMRPTGFKQDVYFAALTNVENLELGKFTGSSAQTFVPDREQMGAVYRLLKDTAGPGVEISEIYAKISDKLSFEKTFAAALVLEELGILKSEGVFYRKKLKFAGGSGKVKLEDSEILARLKSEKGGEIYECVV